jgi:hypothetical protein
MADTTSRGPFDSRQRYLTEEHLSAELFNSRRSLQRRRAEGTGPPFIKVGRRVLYDRNAVEDWLARRSFTSTAEAKEAGVR